MASTRVLQAGAAGVEAGDQRDRDAERDDGAQRRPPAGRPLRQEEADEAEGERESRAGS